MPIDLLNNAEWWVMRIVRAFTSSLTEDERIAVANHSLEIVNGELVEPLYCECDQDKAVALMEREQRRHPDQRYKLVMNSDL